MPLMEEPTRARATTRASRIWRPGWRADDYGTGYSSLAYIGIWPSTK